MKADFTRNTFRPFEQFTRVLMQQGRVQLDSDWNEQNAILLHYLQALAADLIGPHGGPAANLGFTVTPVATTNANQFDLVFSPGNYYVDGILCQIEAFPVAIAAFQPNTNNTIQVAAWNSSAFQTGRYVRVFDAATQPVGTPIVAAITAISQSKSTLTLSLDVSSLSKAEQPMVLPLISYTTQPDYPGAALLNAQSYQVYLDVWERLITFVEDDAIREVALGGPDTAARAKLICQVKVTAPGNVCLTSQNLESVFQPPNRGMLIARAAQTSKSSDPCIISPNASYRGPENQLYRVEIHTGTHDASGNPDTPTFKWSRENGCVVFPIVSGGGTDAVTLANLGKDDRFGLSEGDWVEVQDDAYVLLNGADALLQVQSIDTTNMIVTLGGGAVDAKVGGDPSKHPLLRRWDQKAGDPDQDGLQLGADNAALISESSTNWLALEDGVEIQFQPAPAGQTNEYRTGDYWLIPARTATGNVLWPTGVAKPPDGITHHYAPLAIAILTKPFSESCQVTFTPQHTT
jgi:Family of unknown function (DUF6519)